MCIRRSFTLHIFADSSLVAYGVVSFIVSENGSYFLMSKSRVSPIKKITIPKLELTSASIACRLSEFLKSSFSDTELLSTFWSDSQIALFWINSEPEELVPYVRDRVREISKFSSPSDWYYVPSELNPADLMTKPGISFLDLKNSNLWKYGPEFLLKSRDSWPKWSVEDAKNDPNLFAQCTLGFVDVNTCVASNVNIVDDYVPNLSSVIDITRFSSMSKLLRVTCYVLRFVNRIRNRKHLTISELHNARMLWIKSVQRDYYAKEISLLKINRRNQLIYQLDLFVDSDSVLRSKGRIANADIPITARFPIVLPPKHEFSKFLVLETHKLVLHAGIQSTMIEVRQNFWIPKLRQLVRSLLHKCVPCRKQCGASYMYPKTPPLPDIRVKDIVPFNRTGVDFTGEISVYSENLIDTHKAYITIFTCAVTRAVCLQLVTDMSVKTFMLAFRRFSARFSVPTLMLSDRGSTFLSADKVISNLCKNPNLFESLTKLNCDWQFAPARSPWFSGFIERMVQSTKAILKRVLGRQKLTYLELFTLLCEIEQVLNNRPLIALTSDISDPMALSPNMLIYGRNLEMCPYPVVTPDELNDPNYEIVNHQNLLDRSNLRASLFKRFIDQYRSDYLTSLRERHSCKGTSVVSVKPGDVVLIHDEGNRLYWNLGVILNVHYSSDNLVRSATVRSKSGVITRPIIKLFPLEVSAKSDLTPTKDVTDNLDPVNPRPQRQAKDVANLKIREIFKDQS